MAKRPSHHVFKSYSMGVFTTFCGRTYNTNPVVHDPITNVYVYMPENVKVQMREVDPLRACCTCLKAVAAMYRKEE